MFLFKVSSSNDGRLCLWDLQAGQSLREIPWTSPLTSVCCLVRKLYSCPSQKTQSILFSSFLNTYMQLICFIGGSSYLLYFLSWDKVFSFIKELQCWLAVWCFCVQGLYVIAGCADGALHVWNWETSVEICHITAHKQRIHHCSLLPNTGNICLSSLYCSMSVTKPYFDINISFSLIIALFFKTRTKKSTQKKWLFSLRLMMAQCSFGNPYRSVI